MEELRYCRTIKRSLTELLREMAPGRECCMYCGDSQGSAIDHHEPMARAPIRTFDWGNHLLACTHCNSNLKRDQYPVDDDGQSLLIHPCIEDPFDHLVLTLSLCTYVGTTAKGSATIEVFGLNRPILTRGRKQAKNVLVLALDAWANVSSPNRRLLSPADALSMITEQPFADVCQAMLRQAVAPGAEIIFDELPGTLEILQDDGIRAQLTR